MEENSVRRTLLAVRAEIGAFTLPTWEEMPALPLYMDQVILLLNRYLRMAQDASEERGVTPAMINNYVKQRLVPPPEKKRYGRRHLAYLTMVCLLKQSISTGEISRLLPVEPDEERTRALFTLFTDAVARTGEYFAAQLDAVSANDWTRARSAEQMVFALSALGSMARMTGRRLMARMDDGQEQDEVHA